VADVNGDGIPDIILTEAETLPARAAWFEGPDWVMHPIRDDLCHAHSLEVADFNGDGTLDILIAEMNLGRKDDPKLYIYLNDGAGNLEEQVFENPIGTHESKVGTFGDNPRPSVVIKPFQPHNRIELWENVT
jgi:hypothetical protein